MNKVVSFEPFSHYDEKIKNLIKNVDNKATETASTVDSLPKNNATTSEDGYMSAEDKAKLDNIEERANKMENGILDAILAGNILDWLNLHQQRHETMVDAEILGELHTVTLTNTANLPFNSTMDIPTTVAITKTRKNLFYSVETEVTAQNGLVGDIIISNKALNGFKIAFTGSGKSVTLAVRVKGGMS